MLETKPMVGLGLYECLNPLERELHWKMQQKAFYMGASYLVRERWDVLPALARQVKRGLQFLF